MSDLPSSGGPLKAEPKVDLTTAAFNQNAETFRSLNQLMWQIPLIAMTLTGGLWFGVSSARGSFWFQIALLLMAAAGNVGLIIILHRLRFIMERYLGWLRDAAPAGFVSAEGRGLQSPFVVRRTFQGLLALAAAVSLALAFMVNKDRLSAMAENQTIATAAYYDRFAEDLASAYEALNFQTVHPYLVERLKGRTSLQVLDIGSGSGRDAAWFADKGYRVTAIEPSKKMLALARRTHPETGIAWAADELPRLASLDKNENSFDLILLSAVWMHLAPEQRSASIKRLSELLVPSGEIYLTFRSGSVRDTAREEFPSSVAELQRLAFANALEVQTVSRRPDLLGRAGVEWVSVSLRPKQKAS
jgi:SAM-dependent methyltransferase